MLAIFNPEHDLCLANGDANYVPPASALRFARQEAHLMKSIYGDDCEACAAEDVKHTQALKQSIVAWGWNKVLVTQLCKQGVPRELMPGDGQLETIRQLSHRRTAASARQRFFADAPAVSEATGIGDVEHLLSRMGRIVLKAPWSGSGRGLRWVDGSLSELDKKWVEKILATQGSVMVEPRLDVVQDFALEYYIGVQPAEVSGRKPLDVGQHSILPCAGTHFWGYSLFSTQNGVYRENRLLSDEQILQHLSEYVPMQAILSAKAAIEEWLETEIAPQYEGPLGIDMFIYRIADGYALNPMVEINFRHTMGHVAVALRNKMPGRTFCPVVGSN